jgi:hypothetical protein
MSYQTKEIRATNKQIFKSIDDYYLVFDSYPNIVESP